MSGGAPRRKGSTSRRARARAGRSTKPKKKKKNTEGAPESERGSTERAAVMLVHERLRQRFGTPRPESHQAPLDEVVFTILSQNTTDTNRDRAWAGLWRRFDGWPQIAAAPVEEIAAAIEIGGLHRVKAQRIKALLQQIEEEHGDFDLDFLQRLDIEQARRELRRYKGVGEKSINCILLFSLGQPAFPVDTHVHRIFRRLGIIASGDLARANREAQRYVPDDIVYPLHMNVIRYGREVCHARRPACGDCCIEDLCGYEGKNLEQN